MAPCNKDPAHLVGACCGQRRMQEEERQAGGQEGRRDGRREGRRDGRRDGRRKKEGGQVGIREQGCRCRKEGRNV